MHSKVIGDDRIVDGKIRYEFLIQSSNNPECDYFCGLESECCVG